MIRSVLIMVGASLLMIPIEELKPGVPEDLPVVVGYLLMIPIEELKQASVLSSSSTSNF